MSKGDYMVDTFDTQKDIANELSPQQDCGVSSTCIPGMQVSKEDTFDFPPQSGAESNRKFIEILNVELNITPMEITRYTTGYCHSVYCVKTQTDKFILRVTSKENKGYYDGSVKWLNVLAKLEIPIPKILKHGRYFDVYYVLMTYIRGKDIGEVYHALNDSQKHSIVKELTEIQRKVSTLPPDMIDGAEEYSSATRAERIENSIHRSRKNITANKVFDPSVCDAISTLTDTFKGYLTNIKPVAFLDDISTKNVLIHNGILAGVVDIDEMGYGDPLEVVGLTNMALLAMSADTKYIDYWLDEMKANSIQKKAVIFYSLLSCVDFMGERGTKFDNGRVVPVNQAEVDLLYSIYHRLLTTL